MSKSKKKIKELERRIRDLELITGLRGVTVMEWENECTVTIKGDDGADISKPIPHPGARWREFYKAGDE